MVPIPPKAQVMALKAVCGGVGPWYSQELRPCCPLYNYFQKCLTLWAFGNDILASSLGRPCFLCLRVACKSNIINHCNAVFDSRLLHEQSSTVGRSAGIKYVNIELAW